MAKFDRLKQITDQLLSQGNSEIVDSAFSESYVAHSGDKNHKGHAFIKQFIKQLRTAIPDLKIVKIEVLAQSENLITWQRTLSGTHKAALKGIPASHKKIKWYEMVVTRFEGDKIAEEWLISDLAFQMMLKLK
ncbi:MAG: ester cyclase [Cytophagaceae bacterium]|nr:ester cyclase [Cytophagaceae bacterium]MBK9935945.1 ester cyclase [Cytophagaceae bacterium]MBL0304174.1 ester cyclase [Cytophagaceae bacterium]MBL0326984.1 ester cyclase [Cytophagaceae bacterium]